MGDAAPKELRGALWFVISSEYSYKCKYLIRTGLKL